MLNNVTLMGRLTADPELRQTPKGNKVCNFSIAIQRPKQKDSDPETDFFQCVAWKGSAELIEKYFGKGNMIAIQGRLRNETYLKKDEKRTATKIVVEKVFFTGEHHKDKQSDHDSKSEYSNFSEISEITDDEIEEILTDEGVPF